MNRQVPTGYVKSNYKVNCSQTPTAKDLSSKDAAEIIAQEAYRLTKKSLDNQTINLVYSPLTNTCNSEWTGNITFNANDTMSVIIDGSTGELLHIRHNISIPVASPQKKKTDAETDQEGISSLKSLIAEFNKNKDANCAKAQELITKSGYVPETIKTFTYADSCSGLQFANNKVISTSCAHIFNAVTTSDKTYKFYLSRDLTHITEVWTPEFLAQLDAIKDPINEPLA